jgi:outer membrane immunogenic protein
MIKRIILATASVVALSAAANAADMYRASAGGYKDGPAYAEVNWSGFYIGANVGGAWGTQAITDTYGFMNGIPGKSWDNKVSGVTGGGQIGYNYQMGHFVFGPEIDLGYTDAAHSNTIVATNGVKLGQQSVSAGFTADVTGRLGYAVDRALIYAKGGYAYYGGTDTYDDTVAKSTASVTGLSGWTVGAGVEYKINPALSLKGEYQHFDFGSNSLASSYNYAGCPGGNCSVKDALTIDTVKVGVNYFVNSGYSPLK